MDLDNYKSVLIPAASLFVGIFGGFVAFYYKATIDTRERIARSLSDFYSSAAAVYYARQEYASTSDEDEDCLVFYKLYDQHYKEFLSASTFLASIVPPDLVEEILKVEDEWESINELGFTSASSKKWFNTLDAVRYLILGKIRHGPISFFPWK